jgi:hypothetical protein
VFKLCSVDASHASVFVAKLKCIFVSYSFLPSPPLALFLTPHYSLLKMERYRRNEIAKEILVTEKKYVQNLGILDFNFILSLYKLILFSLLKLIFY